MCQGHVASWVCKVASGSRGSVQHGLGIPMGGNRNQGLRQKNIRERKWSRCAGNWVVPIWTQCQAWRGRWFWNFVGEAHIPFHQADLPWQGLGQI